MTGRQLSCDGNDAKRAAVYSCNELPCMPTWCAVIFSVAVACFINSYNGDFAFDDAEALMSNKDVIAGNESVSLTDVFMHDFWGSHIASNTSHKSYRPLTVLTFRVNYWLAGGLFPLGFHIVNIILHGVVSVIFLLFISVFLSDGHSFTPDGSFILASPKASVLCAILFATHPVHTESVAAVVGRADLLCAMCFMLAFLFHIKAIYSVKLLVQLSSYLMSAVLVILSVLFKEPGITVLGICSVYELIVVARINPFDSIRLNKYRRQQVGTHSYEVCIWSVLRRQLYLAALGVVLLTVRWKLMGSTTPTFQVVENPHSFLNGTMLRILNYNYIYALNIWLLLNPTWLCFDWSMGCVPVITSVADPRLLVVGGLWLAVFIMLFYTAVYLSAHEQRLVLLTVGLMVLPFLPASNLLFRVGFVIAERNLYLPSTGFILLVVIGVQRLRQYQPKLVGFLLVVLLSVYVVRCVQRSAEWKTEKSLFESALAVCPLNAKVHYNIAKIHADLGHVEFAIDRYQQAIRLHPKYDQALNNLGNLYKDRGLLEDAETVLRQAVNIRPEFAAAWMNLGIVQAAQHRYTDAELSYRTALRHRRNYPDCYYNLGNLFLDQQRHTEALWAWLNATNLRPTHVSAWTNAIILLSNLGRYDELQLLVSQSVYHNPLEASLHFHYASSLGRAGKFEESEQNFKLAIEKATEDTSLATFHANLGVLYHRWGKLDEAERSYQSALRLDPSNKQTLDNMQLLFKKKHKV